ncbi:MAG: HDOD domain-containing protein [Burkholderiaceae bacterium]|nr:MAG: HDOD domain-containing protein [Burkholderiaceae bacterium]MBE7426354.1 HDOD domain-containing protein [Ideonella sp.]MCC7286264.1 HDOD domain-containing protein [Burkholderiaceae bacterium]
MNDQSVLGQIVLGYSPMVDRHRAISAARLTVFPSRADAAPDAAALLEAVAEVWPADGGRVSLNVASEAALNELVRFKPAANVMLEIPAFMACDLANGDALRAMHAHGSTLLIKGRPLQPLPREVLPCFAYSIIDLADERRDGSPPPGGVTRTIPHIQAGVRTLVEMEQAFQRGAIAVLGWPIDDVVAARNVKGGPRPELQFIVELINRVDREEPADRLEAVLKTDPTLAFRLMRYINSPAFGLSVEINSFRHAIMVLGYNRLKRWLALLLASASRDPNVKPVMYAAVRRGLLMEELGSQGADADQRSEMFICGVFSLLDRLMGQPLPELMRSIPVPETVRAALAEQSGPYHAQLELVRAIESESVIDIRNAAEATMLGLPEVNRAVLRALAGARQLD